MGSLVKGAGELLQTLIGGEVVRVVRAKTA